MLGGCVTYDVFELISEIDDIVFDCFVEDGSDILDKAIKTMVQDSDYEANFDVECAYEPGDNEIQIKTDNVSNNFGSRRSIESVQDTLLQTLSRTIMDVLDEHELGDSLNTSDVLDRLYEADMTKTSESYFGNTVEQAPVVRVPDSVSVKFDVLDMVNSADDLMVDGSTVFKNLVDAKNRDRSLSEDFLVDISYEEGDCEAVFKIIGFDEESALDIKGVIANISTELHAEYAKTISIELDDEELDTDAIRDELAKPELASERDILIALSRSLSGAKVNKITLSFDKDRMIDNIDNFLDSEVSLQTSLTGDGVTDSVVEAINNAGSDNVRFSASQDVGVIDVIATYSDAVNFDAFTVQNIIMTADDAIRKVIADETNHFPYKSQIEASKIVEKYVSKKYGSKSLPITCAIKNIELLTDNPITHSCHEAYAISYPSDSKSELGHLLPFAKAKVVLSEDTKNDLDKIAEISERKGRERVLTSENSQAGLGK